MKHLMSITCCLLAAAIMVEVGRAAFKNRKIKSILLNFFTKEKNYVKSYLRILIQEDEFISESNLEKFHNDILGSLVESLSASDLILISHHLREPRTLKEEIKRYNFYLMKANIIYRPLKLKEHPIERINQ